MAPPELSAHAQLTSLLAMSAIAGVRMPTPPLLQGEKALLALAGNPLVQGIFYLFPIKLKDFLYVR